MQRAFDHDVIVIGGGPAGAAAAARLARRGRSVAVVEAETFPRFHVGESLLPLGSSVFRDIGIEAQLADAGFVRKYGALLVDASGERRVLFDFQDALGIDPNWTFQVHRAKFDQLVLDHAVASGAVRVHGRAKDFAIDADGVDVTCDLADGASRTLRAKAIVDASGRNGFVAKRAGVRVPDDALRKAAVYAHFRGVPREAGLRAGDTRVVSTDRLGWIWYIPLEGDVTSVGAVMDLSDYKARDKGDPRALFDAVIAATPSAAAWMRDATRVGDFRVESGFSYSATRYYGDRWVLAGDAGSFLDPVFSTGVLLALHGGVDAADAVDAAFVRGARSVQVLARYDAEQQRRYRFLRRFVVGFYDPHLRDVLFAPRPYLGMTRAVTTVFAGGFTPGFLDRLRLAAFFAVARLQRRFELVPRVHGVSTASA